MTTGFAAILLGALILSGILSWLQHRAYSKATERLRRQFRGSGDAALVSGRGKGRLRGAVVLLVIDSRSRRVIAAEAMIGASVLARFHERPELLGGLGSIADRAREKRLADATLQAMEQYKLVMRKNKTRSAS
ncbi:MAG: transcriptional regulator [Microbacteriaceae bacterium]|nr:MAG: transcriptional regulator [Microbacteriaceae bacterium]